MSKRFLHPDDIFHDVNYEKNKWYMKNFFNVERFKPRRKGSRNLITIAASSPSLRATYLSGHEWRVSVNSFELISSSVWKIERTYVKSVWIENNFEPTMLTIYCHSPKRISTHYRPLVSDISSGHLRIHDPYDWVTHPKTIMGYSSLLLMPSPVIRCGAHFDFFFLYACTLSPYSICLFLLFSSTLGLSFIFFLSHVASTPFPTVPLYFSLTFCLFRPCIYLSVCLFRPCVVCVCIRATSGIE